MHRPDSARPSLIRPVRLAVDAERKWLGFHALRLAMGVLGQGRPVEAVLSEDLPEPAFTELLEATDPAAPLDWDRVSISHDPQRITLRADSGLERTVVRNGRHGLQVLPSGAAEPLVRAPEPEVPQREIGRPWPLGDEPETGQLPAGAVSRIRALLDRLTSDGLGRAAVVAHRGKLVAESYAPGFPREMRHNGWSATKSVAGVLAGRLVHEGLLELDRPAPVPEWAHDARSGITLRHLLAMSSGLDCPPGAAAWAHGDRHFGVYAGPDDVWRDMSGLGLLAPPGTRCAYQNSDPLLSAGIAVRVAAAAGLAEPVDVPWRLLFDPLGMDSVLLGSDAAGNFLLSGVCLATALDWARFGQFVLDDGVWQGRRLLPGGWLDYVLAPAEADDEGLYGGGLCWLGRPVYEGGVPDRTALASGMYGQRVFVLPEHELVVVRLGQGDDEELLAAVVCEVARIVAG
ncbi:serine hydrolase domain-containing protein [Amycolatopsis panacis]|nr:serine hydrolase [Amycolatopsis panacis]